MILVIIGGLVSLVSALAAIILQHLLSLSRQKHETRQFPREVLFKKQTDFYDKVVPLLFGINTYITTIDVWLAENSPEGEAKVQDVKGETQAVWQFNELIGDFSAYLPHKILLAGEMLFEKCVWLSRSPSMELVEQSVGLLYSFRRTIRECVGADKISDDLLKAFETQARKQLTGDDIKAR